jgi:hypothetical protein
VAEQSVKMTLPNGRVVDGLAIGVKRSIEQWSEFEFEDGSKIKAKITVTGANRAINDYDPSGVPWYQIAMVPVASPMEVPDELKEKKEK